MKQLLNRPPLKGTVVVNAEAGQANKIVKLIPNILTIGRLVLTLIFLVMILYSPKAANKSLFLDIAFIIFLVAGLTDIIDGKVARMFNVTSKFGRMLDPLADKILVCGAFICFAIIGQPKLFNLTPTTLAIIQWFVAIIIATRELFVTILRHRAEAHGINFAATASGKIKMFLQSFGIGTVVMKAAHVEGQTWGDCFTATTLIIMVIVTVTSGLSSLKRGHGT